MSSDRSYYNYLNDRKDGSSFLFASKTINATKSFYQERPPTPFEHKVAVLNSRKIQELLTSLSEVSKTPRDTLEKQVRNILDEIGYNKNFKVIRWLGLMLTNIYLRTCSGIYTNNSGVEKLRSRMGDCPVIFVPSHRSYADFIHLSYFCFTYDIAIPAIAAGMDFHGMWGMGTLLRDTGAFFMRRSYNNDNLYWTTFKQYIYQLVSKGDLPIEFFIEGTRSRSGKSLTPKYGLISMVLKAFFLCQVPDVLFVPISICYDRVLEESLFAFEHLGVPKPKESTSGLFKSVKILKEKFGSTYIHFAPPISVKDFFGDQLDRTVHNLAPLHQQELTAEEKNLLPPLAHEIVHSQQKHSVITVFNLIAAVLNTDFTSKMNLNELHCKINDFKGALEEFGAYIPLSDLKDIEEAIVVHKNLIEICGVDEVHLRFSNVILGKQDPAKLKGHSLSNKTMTFAVPLIMLQIYVNPIIHYFIDAALCIVILQKESNLSKAELFGRFKFLRGLFLVEFVTYGLWIPREFEEALSTALRLNLIVERGGAYELGSNELVLSIFKGSIQSYLIAYGVTLTVLQGFPQPIKEKSVLKKVQLVLENLISEDKEFVHPYCLSLETLGNCLSVLTSQKALDKKREDNQFIYKVNPSILSGIKNQLDKCAPLDNTLVPMNSSQKILNKL